jgi:D-tyrosyl-tRNA(Tyr) deacylase
VVPNFTLFADTRKGRRPSFNEAAGYDEGRGLYDAFVLAFRAAGVAVECGEYGAHMEVDLVNDGPVTLVVDTKPVSDSV